MHNHYQFINHTFWGSNNISTKKLRVILHKHELETSINSPFQKLGRYYFFSKSSNPTSDQYITSCTRLRVCVDYEEHAHSGDQSSYLQVLFPCIYFYTNVCLYLLFFWPNELHCEYADMDFHLDEVLKTLPTPRSDKGVVHTDGRFLDTLLSISYFYASSFVIL